MFSPPRVSNFETIYTSIYKGTEDVPEKPVDPTPTPTPTPAPEGIVSDYITSDNCTIIPDKNDGCTVTQENDYVVFNFTQISQGFYIKPSGHDSAATCKVIVEDIIYSSPSSWTDVMKSKVGFYSSSNNYTVTTGDTLKNSYKGVEFNVSSSYPGTFPCPYIPLFPKTPYNRLQ